MDQLFGRGSAIEIAGVTFFENDDATALDARIFRGDGGSNKVCEGDAGDEAASLVDLERWFSVGVPLSNAHASAKHSGIDSDVGYGLSEGECAAPRLAVFTGLRRSGEGLVAGDLLLCAALVNGCEGEEAGQAGGCGTAIDPG